MFELQRGGITLKLVAISLLTVACSSHRTSEIVEVTSSSEVLSTPKATNTLVTMFTPSLLPETDAGPVITSVPIVSIDMGDLHGLALQENGEVLAWGASSLLGLSEDPEAVQPIPTLLSGVHNMRSIYSSDLYSLFIDEAGRLYELSLLERGEYSLFPNIDQVQEVAAGKDKTLIVLKEDGSLWAWGAGQEGQLGTGDLIDTESFVRVPLDDIAQIAFSRNLALAVRNDGTLWAWGRDEEVTGSLDIWPTPQQVQNVQNVRGVAWGDGVSILHTDGTVTVWTAGEFHLVEQLPPIVQIDGEYQFYTVGVDESGTLWAWGSAWVNAVYGDLDQMPYDRTFGPERFQGHQINLTNVIQVSADSLIILALDKDGTVWAWGFSTYGSAGTGLVRGPIREPTPILVQE